MIVEVNLESWELSYSKYLIIYKVKLVVVSNNGIVEVEVGIV